MTSCLFSSFKFVDDFQSDIQASSGTVIKMHTNMWYSFFENDTVMTVTDDDLLDSSKFCAVEMDEFG